MARLRVLGSPSAKLRTGGYKGEPSGKIELTENHKTYNVADYAEAETNIPDPVLIEKSVTKNGTYSAEDDGADGYLEVDVNIPPPVLERGSAIPKTTAETYTPQGDGFLDFTVEATPLEVKTVIPTTQQQVVTPTAPNIGFSSVTVEGYTDNLDAYIDDTITHISTNAIQLRDQLFSGTTSLLSINMPNITTIGTSCFSGCSNLVITKLPNTVIRISNYAFNGCKSIPHLDMSDFTTIPAIYANAFVGSTFPLYFRDQTQLDAYAAATNWSAYASRFQIKPSEM